MLCEQLKQMLKEGGALIDVRTPQEFALGAIHGAVNIPLNGLPVQIETLPKDKPVLLYCRSGARSGVAQRFLAQAGFDAHNIGAYIPYANC